MREIEFPTSITLQSGDTFSFTWLYDENMLELVTYRVTLDPVREAAEVAAFEQELADL